MLVDISHPHFDMATPSSRQPLWLNPDSALRLALIVLAGMFLLPLPPTAAKLFIAGHMNYEQHNIICNIEPCPPNQLTPTGKQALRNIGISVDWLVRISVALVILNAFTYTLSAIVIFVRKPGATAALLAIVLVTFGIATF